MLLILFVVFLFFPYVLCKYFLFSYHLPKVGLFLDYNCLWLHEECLYLFYLFFFLFWTVLLSIQLYMVCRLILRWYVGSYAEFPLKRKEISYYINSSSPTLLINNLKCFHFPVKQKLTIQWALWNWDYPCCGFFFGSCLLF